MNIYVGNLPYRTTDDELRELFEQFGGVNSARIITDRETGRSRGFGFVDMASEADEQKAIDDLQDVEWMGRNIRVNKAEPRQPRR